MIEYFVMAAAGIFVYNAVQKNKEEERTRKSTPLVYTERLTEDQMLEIVQESVSRIKRITSWEFKTESAELRCSVESNSKISTWNFSIDFNNYGRIDGKYWIKTANHDSAIPKSIAERIAQGIRKKRVESFKL